MLKTAGIAFSGWKEVSVKRSMESFSGTFEITATDRYPGDLPQKKLRPGLECTVEIDGETVITGYVDDVKPSYTSSEHSVSVSGRDKAADLVDCSAVHSPGEWYGQTLDQLAQILAAPFGVQVHVEAPVGEPFAKFTLQKGETAFAAIERLARQRAVLLVSDGQGGLVITRASTQRMPGALKRPGNILAASGDYSDRERHSEYQLLGQGVATAQVPGSLSSQRAATARDPAIRRYRPIVILAEEQPGGSSLEERARWEASTRAGRARRLSITVAGWRHRGVLWQPNRLIRVTDDFLGVDGDFLVAAVDHTRGDGGTLTALSLVKPKAFELLELPDIPDDEGGDLADLRAARRAAVRGGSTIPDLEQN